MKVVAPGQETVSDLGFRVWVLGFRVSGFGFRVQGLGFVVQGLGFEVQGFGGGQAYPPGNGGIVGRYRYSVL